MNHLLPINQWGDEHIIMFSMFSMFSRSTMDYKISTRSITQSFQSTMPAVAPTQAVMKILELKADSVRRSESKSRRMSASLNMGVLYVKIYWLIVIFQYSNTCIYIYTYIYIYIYYVHIYIHTCIPICSAFCFVAVCVYTPFSDPYEL